MEAREKLTWVLFDLICYVKVIPTLAKSNSKYCSCGVFVTVKIDHHNDLP